jgi:hypothetical protein
MQGSERDGTYQRVGFGRVARRGARAESGAGTAFHNDQSFDVEGTPPPDLGSGAVVTVGAHAPGEGAWMEYVGVVVETDATWIVIDEVDGERVWVPLNRVVQISMLAPPPAP